MADIDDETCDLVANRMCFHDASMVI
jgi:hypothetical protein